VGVENKETLPPELEVNSRFLTEDRSAYFDMLPASIEEAIDCAENSDFIQNSEFADIAARYIETIKNTD
jgi:glutamine synthetase